MPDPWWSSQPDRFASLHSHPDPLVRGLAAERDRLAALPTLPNWAEQIHIIHATVLGGETQLLAAMTDPAAADAFLRLQHTQWRRRRDPRVPDADGRYLSLTDFDRALVEHRLGWRSGVPVDPRQYDTAIVEYRLLTVPWNPPAMARVAAPDSRLTLVEPPSEQDG